MISTEARTFIRFPKPVLRRQTARAVGIWFAIHSFLALVSAGEIIVFSAKGSIVLTLLTGAISLLEAKRNNEGRFLENLGYGLPFLAIVPIVVLVGLESLLKLVVS